ncbi:MFS transporter [Curtobacterium sp. SORGH_AS_0776]|uniref:MFS transporter n=1 Tax=Curtobacterium sp. SORGH_AS_0776 TaxID=3041798 RepID=UPI00285B0F59|nr:MFS transporter [Curtobacterium sp. SORGH_AS_0776]MDR6169788.1 MFS family permease [Curtobacterium sp. SORGH_AS_0776]
MHQLGVDEDRRQLAGWRNAIVIAFAIGGVSLAAWGPRLPELRLELGVDVGTIGLMLGGVTIGSIGGLLSAAPLLRRLGGRRALTAVVVLVPVAIAVIGTAAALHSVPLAAAGFVVAGAGIGSLDVMANVEGTAIEALAGRTLLPLMHAAWSGGAALGAGIAALCAWLGITPSGQLLGEAVVILVVGVLAMRGIPDGTRAEEHDTTLTPRQRLRQWARGWADVRLLLIGVVMLGVELGEGSANNWLALATTDGHGQTAAVGALFFTVFAVSEAATRVFAGPVVDRLGRVRTVRWTTALGIVGAVLFIVGGSWWLTLVGVVLWAVGVSMGFPLGMSAAAQSGPNPAARVSVVASIGYFANFAGPPVIGAIAEHVGALSALWLVAVLFVAAFAASGSLRPVVRRD